MIIYLEVPKLEDLQGDRKRQDGELLEGGDRLQLRGFNVKPSLLENGKELFNVPAPPIPLNDGPGLLIGRHRMGGEQSPMHGSTPSGGLSSTASTAYTRTSAG